jgi:hypothetical protein
VLSQRFQTVSRVLALAFLALLTCPLFAQVTSSQAKGNPNAPASKWDVFVGYSILDPKGTFYPIQPDGTVLPVSFKLEKTGMLEDAAYYFTRNVGLVVEGGEHDLFTNTGFANTGSSNSGIFTLQSGLIYRWPGIHLTPFVHGLGGGAYVDGPDHEPYTWGPVVGGGGGLDWYFGCHTMGIRLFEADYEFIHVNSGTSHGTLAADDFVWGDDENINALRLAAGVVFRGSSYYNPVAGCGPMPPPAMTCVATPGVIYPGDPVTITANATGLNPKQTVTYEWTGAGVSGNGSVATVPTSSLAAGTYTVQATVTEGPKHVQSADCEASFTVKAWEAPTLSCTAGPMTINPDQTSTITLEGRSPQNLPLTYTCTSNAGTMTMNGNVGTLSAAGAPEGPVTINCKVKDDKGGSANCISTVTIVVPKPPLPHVQPLCSIDFGNDMKRPTRVDNEAKACLDQVALALQQNPDETLVVVGEAANTEISGPTVVGAQRAVNTKEYLTTEKGIDPSRITVVVGSESIKEVEDYLVPTGATFTSDVPNTTPVDENIVKPQVREPLPMRTHPAAKPAAAKSKPANTTMKPDLRKQPDKSMKPAQKKAPAAPAPAAKGSNGP